MAEEFSEKFWTELKQLQEDDLCCYGAKASKEIPKEEVIRRIEDVIVQVVHQISTGEPPFLQLRHRHSWEKAIYVPNEGLQLTEDSQMKTISFGNVASMEKFGLTLKVLSKIYKLLQTDQVATKRDLYYEETKLFRNQAVLDNIIDDIACMLEVPRRWLNVVATSKGSIAGDIAFSGPDGEMVDCSQSTCGIMVPTLVDLVDKIQSKCAKFLLVVEKDATFQRLQDDNFTTNMQCILITGKGVPDVNTRLMIKKIWTALQIPVLALVDADPYGIEIMCVYRFGSLAQSHDSQSLALPFLKWIGIFPSDIKRLHLPSDVVMSLSDREVAKCRDILARPYTQHHSAVQNEILTMCNNKEKAEIQSLSRFSSKYLSQVYLPSKIKHGDWM